jgi:hypothetical protein
LDVWGMVLGSGDGLRKRCRDAHCSAEGCSQIIAPGTCMDAPTPRPTSKTAALRKDVGGGTRRAMGDATVAAPHAAEKRGVRDVVRRIVVGR